MIVTGEPMGRSLDCRCHDRGILPINDSLSLLDKLVTRFDDCNVQGGFEPVESLDSDRGLAGKIAFSFIKYELAADQIDLAADTGQDQIPRVPSR